jgi:hypothetical protein
MAWQLAQGIEHASILDAFAVQAFDQPIARTLRGHAQTTHLGTALRKAAHRWRSIIAGNAADFMPARIPWSAS